jgi:hypothetical protein
MLALLIHAEPFGPSAKDCRDSCAPSASPLSMNTGARHRDLPTVNSVDPINARWPRNLFPSAGARPLNLFPHAHLLPVVSDWLLWVGLSRVWAGWKSALVMVEPETVLRWQRDRFRRYWTALSRSNERPRGRPAMAPEVRRLILQMAQANPLWRAPRIHGELKMLGIVVSERTVSRVLRSAPRPPSQSWRTFFEESPE